MFPLLPFAAGVLAGAVALRLMKADKAKAGLEKAQDRLRDATVSSLEAIEQASARARQRLAGAAAEAAEPEAAEPEAPAAKADAAESTPAAKAPARRAPRKAAPRAPKAAAKPAARPAGDEPAQE